MTCNDYVWICSHAAIDSNYTVFPFVDPGFPMLSKFLNNIAWQLNPSCPQKSDVERCGFCSRCSTGLPGTCEWHHPRELQKRKPCYRMGHQWSRFQLETRIQFDSWSNNPDENLRLQKVDELHDLICGECRQSPSIFIHVPFPPPGGSTFTRVGTPTATFAFPCFPFGAASGSRALLHRAVMAREKRCSSKSKQTPDPWAQKSRCMASYGSWMIMVWTSSGRYRFDIYRLGWYNGLGARQVASFKPKVKLPQEQPDCHKEIVD